ncbi:glycosyltransferase [Candidatus Dojkabacteria bacterium]|nr:glycosyltransferase [Candidatus Dojkabacteria bacterium]
MLRVAYMIYSSTDPGGEAQVARDMAKQFSEYGESALFYPGDSFEKKQINNHFFHYSYKTGETNLNFNPSYFTPQMLSRLFNMFEDFNPDIIHFHDPTPTMLIAQFWCIKNDVPKVMTLHSLPSQIDQFTDYQSSQNPLMSLAMIPTRQYLGIVLKENDLIFALNDVAKYEIKKIGYEGKIKTIPNGRDLNKFDKSPTKLEKVINLTFIGWISKRKNQEYLLEVLKYLPKNYNLNLYGKYLSKGYKEIFEKLLKKADLENVHLHGYIDHDKIPDILAETHLFVSASLKEVQSLVIIEALASRTPVIGLSNETTSELINDLNGKVLDKDATPKEFASEIKHFMEQSPESYFKKCENARKSVQNHSWENVMEKTISAYHTAIRQNHEQQQASESYTSNINELLKIVPSEKLRKNISDNLNKNPKSQKPVQRRAFWLAALGVIASSVIWLASRILAIFNKKKEDN